MKNVWRAPGHFQVVAEIFAIAGARTLAVRVYESLTIGDRSSNRTNEAGRRRIMLLSADAWAAISAIALVFLVGLAVAG
jgi:hypothetical protein